ncbi:MAG: tRNA 4-thiouridine(8) synthase ThiI [Lachnospiraceae bacterium]|nr:tRNA 4-thiouridine(8) synthase ThiI [Lachnospiraceae bacterium]
MEFRALLIKYAEIGIKGKNRYLFEDKLVSQCARALKDLPVPFNVYKKTGRIYAVSPEPFDVEEAAEALQRVFGVAGICPLVQLPLMKPEELAGAAVDYMREMYPQASGSFKVFTTRADKSYPLESNEINCLLGEAILKAFPDLHVDVHQPQIRLHVEIRSEINLYSRVLPGPGGMPVGTNGKAMLLLSGGIDSPVAGWMVAKRGVTIEAVYFHAPPYTSERARQKVVDLAAEIARYAGPVRLHVVNFTAPQLHIYETCPHEELTIIMRRYMMRIAERLAAENGCLGLVTGESIGQVASQTVHSLAVTNEVCRLPVFRPLIAFDKQDIIDLSKKIGTYETSILPYEDCCTIFVAKHPVTKPNAGIIRRSEERLLPKMDELVEEAIRTAEVVVCG